MTLRELLAGVPVLSIKGDLSLPIPQITDDSREVQPGSLFVASEGPVLDGHVFVPEALKKGASAVLFEKPFPFPSSVATIQVHDARETLSLLAANFYGRPAESLDLVGITGTNGKTTVSYLVEAIFRESGKKVARIGTIDYQIGSRSLPSHNTTPGALFLHRLFREMVEEAVTHGVMEVSSHALEQKRIFGVPLRAAVFTNLTQDHLDYHRSLEDYFEAKLRLFRPLSPHSWAIVNRDDPRGEVVEKATEARVLTYGLKEDAVLRPQGVTIDREGFSCDLKGPFGSFSIRSSLVGVHNVANVLAAIGVGLSQGIPIETIAKAIASVRGVPGRLEAIRTGQPYEIFVDYAHTEEALRQALTSLRSHVKRRLIVVFGCGGDRDWTKRPKMGEVASRLSDWVIVTSDNPRNEDPHSIMEMVVSGFPSTFSSYEAVEDRAEAIGKALEMAEEGDLVLIAGKGHETTQVVKGLALPFDDRQVVREILSKRSQSVKCVG